MDKDQQIAAIKAGLAALDSAIAQAEAALRTASTPDDIRSLTSTLVDLRSERSRLQAQLDNLEASSVEVQALGINASAPKVAAKSAVSKQEMKALHKQLSGAVTDRSVVDATLKFATGVKQAARRLRSIGESAPNAALAKKRSKQN
jgi:hypothetical protein